MDAFFSKYRPPGHGLCTAVGYYHDSLDILVSKYHYWDFQCYPLGRVKIKNTTPLRFRQGLAGGKAKESFNAGCH